MPWQWEVSAVCESFNCLPSQALAELGEPPEPPAGLVEAILLLRNYMVQWQMWQRRRNRGVSPRDYPDVLRVERWLGEEKRLARNRERAGEHHDQAADLGEQK